MGIFSAIFTTKCASATTMLIQYFNPIFYSIETKIGYSGNISDAVINDSYFIGYMTGVMTYVLDINNIKDDFDKKTVLIAFFDHFFGQNSLAKINRGNNGQNNQSNPIFLEARKLAYKETSIGVNSNGDFNMSILKHISDNY